MPVLVGPFLNQLGFVGVQEGSFSEEDPKYVAVEAASFVEEGTNHILSNNQI